MPARPRHARPPPGPRRLDVARTAIARRVGAAAVCLALHGCAGTGAPAAGGPDRTGGPEAVAAPAPGEAPPSSPTRAAREAAGPDPRGGIDETLLAEAFVRARGLVAEATGTPLDDLELVVADDDRIDALVRRETHRLVHAQFDDPRFADRFVERMMRGQRGTFVALYVPRTERVLVNRRLFADYARFVPADAREAAVLALMIHEIVHAADDRRHDIDATRTLDFRASFAESAVYEGHAQWRTRTLCAKAGCLPGLDALDGFMFDAPDEEGPAPNRIAQSAVALSRNVLEYSYVEGERFVEALSRRADGEAALARLLAAPPADPIQILDPDSWPDAARESRNRRLFDAAAGFAHPWHAPGWVRVETSPLKGVNLRADPERRVAAVEGFTRLLVAMGALELHDQRRPDARSIEVTLLEGESAATAALFARTLHANAPGTVRRATGADGDGPGGGDTGMLHAELPGGGDGAGWRTLVARHGPWVVQIAAPGDEPAERLERWAAGTFERLDAAAAALSTSGRSD